MSGSIKNKVIVITRSSDQTESSVKKLESLGTKVIPFPTIAIKPIQDFNIFDSLANKLNEYNYIIFTSENSVAYSLQRLSELNISIPGNLKVVCVGEKSAEKCEEYGIHVDIVPGDYSAKGVLNYFSDKDIKEKKFFIPSSAIAREELKTGLVAQDADVLQTPIHEVGLPNEDQIRISKELLSAQSPDLFIFTSPSTFNNFVEILDIEEPKSYFGDYDVAVIGPTTASALEELGIEVDVVPEKFTMDSLIDSIINFYAMK